MAKYQIFSAKTSRFGELSIVIVTAFFNPGGYPLGESFLLVPDDKEPIFAKSLRFVVKSFPDSPIELNEDFMDRTENRIKAVNAQASVTSS